MKKMLVISLLTFTLVLGVIVQAQAETTKWQINWDESAIVETVSTGDGKLGAVLNSSGFTEEGTRGVYVRHTSDWQTYNKLADKFPILVEDKNYFLFNITTVNVDKNQASNILSNFNQPLDFELTGLGFYFRNTGQKTADSTSLWELGPEGINNLSKPYLTKYFILNGLVLGILIFVIGVMGIATFYFGAIRRANRLITEEYSMETYLARQAEAQKGLENKEE